MQSVPVETSLPAPARSSCSLPLRGNTPPIHQCIPAEDGNSDRTRYNKFGRRREFLTRERLDLLTDGNKPKYSRDAPLVLEQDELEQFCVPQSQETDVHGVPLLWAAHGRTSNLALGRHRLCQRQDQDSRTPGTQLQTEHHCRSVPINDELLEQLHVRKLTAKLPIVFHTRSSKPLTHLWEDTQNIFKKTDVPLEKRSPTLFAGDFLHHPLSGRMGAPRCYACDGTQG